MENRKLCPFNGMKPCVEDQCMMYNEIDSCELAESKYAIIDDVLSHGEFMDRLVNKIVDALETIEIIVER